MIKQKRNKKLLSSSTINVDEIARSFNEVLVLTELVFSRTLHNVIFSVVGYGNETHQEYGQV